MTDRRNFLIKSALAAFGFSVLPAALTYKRHWKKTSIWVPNPEYANAEYEVYFLNSAWYSPQFEGRPAFGNWETGLGEINKFGVTFKRLENGLLEMI